MSELQKIQDEAVRLYRQCASIPSVTNGSISVNDKTLIISSVWSQRNLELNKKRPFSRRFYYSLDNIESGKCFEENFPRQVEAEQLCCESKSGQFQAVVRKIPADQKNKEDTQNIEIWSKSACIKCYTSDAVLDKHGKINDDVAFGCLTWSPCERYLLYAAEKKFPKATSYFEAKKQSENAEEKSEKGKKYEFKEDWGEQLVGVHVTVLVVLDTEKDEVRVLDGIPDDICPGQAIWAPGGDGVIFCGRNHEPYRLGLKYCHNRKSGIYYLSLDGKSCEKLSDGTESVSFPRLSPDGNKLIYASRMLYGPHLCCKKILMYDWKAKTTRTLLDEVDKPDNAYSFPGLFSAGIAKRIWSEDGSMIVLDTAWRSKKDIIIIDANSGNFQKVTGDWCWTLLDVHKDFVLASFSTPASPPTLMLAKLPTTALGQLAWITVAESRISLEKEITWKVVVFTPENIDKGTWQDYEGILMKPKVDPEHKCQLIVFPHGGPHTVMVADFMLYPVMFCQLGYAVLLVNYRGSLGFGQSFVTSLPGNIGTQDVRDVQYAAETVLKTGAFDEDRVFVTGGSHGGFLAAHLVGQYPDFYKACAMRNPVINLTAMVATSDIPDWCHCEVGEKFSFDTLPSVELQTKLLQKSPIIHADKVKAATLLLLGGVDLRVPPSQGKEFYKTLRSRGVETKLLFYPEDNHPLAKVETEADAFINTLLWFASH